jgi:hypothetical protein
MSLKMLINVLQSNVVILNSLRLFRFLCASLIHFQMIEWLFHKSIVLNLKYYIILTKMVRKPGINLF